MKKKKKKWEKEKQQGYNLIGKLQEENQKLKNDSNNSHFNNSNHTLDNPQDEIFRLNNELQATLYSVDNFQNQVNELTNENTRLWSEVLTLRDSNSALTQNIYSLTKNNNSSNSNSNSNHLNKNNIAMMEINDQANLQFRNQYQPSSKHLFKTSDISPVEEIQRLNAFIETGKLRLQSLEKENEMLKKENNTLHNKLKQKGERFNVRPGTVTEWKPEELEMLKEEMMSSMLELQKKRYCTNV